MHVDSLLPASENEKSTEVRLGLVMYGGVSLAIYIYGVAFEFSRAVRGQGIYRLIKALTDSDVVVDILSGTSAGGINGILLAFALCNDRDLAQAGDLWRTHGGIGGLLRKPWNDPAGYQSVLDSEGYYEPRLRDAFRQIYEARYEPDPLDDPSKITELDLFVTGTDVDGAVHTQFDDAGHPIDVKEHRAVFLLKHRPGRKEQLNPASASDLKPEITFDALAKLARITSCFPAAFAPVYVGNAGQDEESADAKLQLWGALGRGAHFLDGGVLDNKPFSHTIKAIFSRAATRQVERKLFYVEPDPERFAEAAKAAQAAIGDSVAPAGPNPLRAVVASLIGIPGYESIGEDLRLIAERNSKLKQYDRIVRDLFGPDTEPSAPSPETKKLYDRSRMVAFSERIVQGIFRTRGRNDCVAPEDRERASELVRQFDDLDVDPNFVFGQLDVYVRLRRLYRLVYLIYTLLYENHGTADADRVRRYKALWPVLNRQIELFEILRSAMEQLVDDAEIPWKDPSLDVWKMVDAALRSLLAAVPLPSGFEAWSTDEWGEKWLTPAHLEKVREELARQVKTLGKRFAALGPAPETVLPRIDSAEARLLHCFLDDVAPVAGAKVDPILRAYERFEDLDMHLFPLEMVGGLNEKDIIETIRISPLDANRGFSNRKLEEKVSGDAVHHFGGFFKRSWRSNDILWGQLDGLCQLAETLLDPKRLKKIIDSDSWRRRVRKRFFDSTGKACDALDLERLFPSASRDTREALDRWLSDLLGEDKARRAEALEKLPGHVELLIEVGQLEVLRKEVPRVVEDAVAEQQEWNRYQVETPNGHGRRTGDSKPLAAATVQPPPGVADDFSTPWVFKAGRGQVDRLLGGLAAAETARSAMDRLTGSPESTGRPIDSPLGYYFRNHYNVGSENLQRDIPTVALLDTLSTTLLVLRNCVLQIFGDAAVRVRRNPLYIFGFNLPLLAFHAVVRLWRNASWAVLAVCGGAGLASAIALTIACFWNDTLIWSEGGGPQVKAILWLMVLPAFVLFAELIALAEYARGRGWWWRLGIDLTALALVIGLVGFLIERNEWLAEYAQYEGLRIAAITVFVGVPAALLVLRIAAVLGRKMVRR
jgi:hypothetical protein